jgi:hypothetical protein
VNNPHNLIRRQGDPPHDWWKCHYCHQEGTLETMNKRTCTYDYPSCDDCGQTPECAPDCPGMIRVLGMS